MLRRRPTPSLAGGSTPRSPPPTPNSPAPSTRQASIARRVVRDAEATVRADLVFQVLREQGEYVGARASRCARAAWHTEQGRRLHETKRPTVDGTGPALARVMKHTHEQLSTGRSSPVDVGALLVEEHARLEKLLNQLAAAFQGGDRDECAALWNRFDSGLEAHVALEEELILPEFAKADAAEAAALEREHVAIRSALGELGIGVDLHCTSADAVERLRCMLEDHAKREEALMYRWAQANLRPRARASTQARLRIALRNLVPVL